MNMISNSATFETAVAPESGSILSSKAMLASLNITQWTARKLDKRVTQKVNADHGAAHNAGNYNKALIAGDALSRIVTASNAARECHYHRTLPWLDNGARILPAAAFMDYSKDMRKCREEFESAVAEFVANFPQYVEDAARRLGDMYNPAEYPGAAEIAAKFSFQFNLYQIPVADDFRVQVSDTEAAAIKAQIEERAHNALDSAMRAAWERIVEHVGKMAEKLKEYQPAKDGAKPQGVFRDSLVENVRDLARILPSLNLTGNPQMAAISDRIERELCRFDADELRESEITRNKVKEAAAQIAAQVSDFI